ncbi:1,4-beta-xylanase [Mucilaginibacter daejeonensis]|uniref:1,4-beta-xylanase n=1 Tax=Mucilaginibacter daejeonensis TaxID=398049 RepID=UPI001D171334|nr:1,4-beta-xylanase [Mucilaginibacter daejeonensis]UEG52474.1 1,4-beta-xylanase [Mucilaginibacter daejeonensis]
MNKLNQLLWAAALSATTLYAQAQAPKTAKQLSPRWSIEKAAAWQSKQGWVSGANFIPSTAINQLEMWQASTFDPQTIDRELGWAEGIGFNAMRVFLHSLAYKQDPAGFKKRVDQYLRIATKHHIKTIFVFFDDCWNPDPKIGKQPEPKTGVHNSGWAQDPGRMITDPKDLATLSVYVKDVMTTFGHDERILLWDLYNEPGNSKKGNASMGLLTKIFEWARGTVHDQPVSAGLWKWELNELNTFQALNSDVITYHEYEEPEKHLRIIQMLRTHGRPMVCTEYMARRNNSLFSNVLPMLKKENVGAINWGLVAGKTNTIYAWDTPIADGSEPKLWFHDIFRKDGTMYKQDEVEAIKKATDRK